MTTHILIIEDDINLSTVLADYLQNKGYVVATAPDGQEGWEMLMKNHYDLVLSDITMPRMNGWQLLKSLRDSNNQVPLIFVTAKTDREDIIRGYNLGCDDYVTKPYSMDILICKIEAVLRRYKANANQNDEEVIKFENIEISLQKYELKLSGKSVDVPPKELELLYFLTSNYNRVFTRDQLLDKVWGFDYLGDSRTVDVHVKRLREKLDGVSDRWSLKTVWGVGYKFEVLS